MPLTTHQWFSGTYVMKPTLFSLIFKVPCSLTLLTRTASSLIRVCFELHTEKMVSCFCVPSTSQALKKWQFSFFPHLTKMMSLLQWSNGIATFTWRCLSSSDLMESPHSPGDAGIFTGNGGSWGGCRKSERRKNYPADGEPRSQPQICDTGQIWVWLPVQRPFWRLCSLYRQTRPSTHLNRLPVAHTNFCAGCKDRMRGQISMLHQKQK